MKEELSTKLVEILTSIQTAAGKASDFALEQLPDIAQSYVLYGRAISLVMLVSLIVLGLSLLKLSHWAYKNPWNNSYYTFEKDAKRSDSNFIVMVIPAVVGLVLLLVAVASFDYLVWFAPKVWLLKELATLIK